MLPAAWYELQTHWPSYSTLGPERRVRHEELTREDLQHLLLGKDKMKASVQQAFVSLRQTASEACVLQPIEQDDFGNDIPLPDGEEEALCPEYLTSWFNEQVTAGMLNLRKGFRVRPYDVFAELKYMKTSLFERGGGASLEGANHSVELFAFALLISVHRSRRVRSLQD